MTIVLDCLAGRRIRCSPHSTVNVMVTGVNANPDSSSSNSSSSSRVPNGPIASGPIGSGSGGPNRNRKTRIRASEGAEPCGAGACRARPLPTPASNCTSYMSIDQAYALNTQLEDTAPYNRVRRRASQWRRVTSDSLLLEVIESGLRLRLRSVPPPLYVPEPLPQTSALRQVVQEYADEGAV